MKKILAAAAVVTALATPALSADMAVKARAPIVNPAYDWSGFYFGAAVGGTWAEVNRIHDLIPGSYAVNDTRLHYAGFGGVQKQFGDWVLGVEAAWNSNAINLNGVAPAPPFTPDLSFSNQIMDTVTVGGRLGYAGWNNWLVYATGGWASARVSTEYFTTSTGAPTLPGFWGSRDHQGWYAGAGFEYMIYKGVIADTIIGAEYQHLDFSRANHFFNGTASNRDVEAHEDIVRARLSFKFNPWRPAAVVAKY